MDTRKANIQRGRNVESSHNNPLERTQTGNDELRRIMEQRELGRSPSWRDLRLDTRSHPELVDQYAFLSHSRAFQQLRQEATHHGHLLLKDIPRIPDKDAPHTPNHATYDPDTHTIYVPLEIEKRKERADGGYDSVWETRSISDVRYDLAWEMHNASMREAHTKTNDALLEDDLHPNATAEEVEAHTYKRATYALASEWDEWIGTREHDLRIKAINAEPIKGEIGPHIPRKSEIAYSMPGQDWHNFLTYLGNQVEDGHTTEYDSKATQEAMEKQSWVGLGVVDIASGRYPDAFRITEQQERDWEQGRTSKIQPLDNNPFKKPSIIDEARRYYGSSQQEQ